MDQTYRYLRPSEVRLGSGRADVVLATSGGMTSKGRTEHPVFFDGFLGHPEQSAAALLSVAKVARTRFYTPPGMVAAILRAADPVVTSNGDRLRFESFSACCGVYARLDVLPGGLDGPALDTGTTNVDFNPPMRDALARVGGIDPLHLSVGEDLVVTTMDGRVTERKVPLPDRWLKGFAEVQLSASRMRPVIEVPAVEARRFVRSLPPGTGSRTRPAWVVAAGNTLRLTSRPSADGVCLSGPERLRPLEPLLRFARSLRVYAPPHDAATPSDAGLWELTLDGARLLLVLSPDVARGFSGEGGVLWDLSDEQAAVDAELLSALLSFEPRIDVPGLAAGAAVSERRVRRALGHLGAAGRVGYDAAEEAYFHRELPFDPERMEAMHPRLRAARELVDAGAVRIVGDLAYVRSAGTEHVVRRRSGGSVCSCPWYSKHRSSRGPCKHLLAVELSRRAAD